MGNMDLGLIAGNLAGWTLALIGSLVCLAFLLVAALWVGGILFGIVAVVTGRARHYPRPRHR